MCQRSVALTAMVPPWGSLIPQAERNAGGVGEHSNAVTGADWARFGGNIASHARASEQDRTGAFKVPDTAAGASEHPECCDEARLNNPNDFCYRTMGPWNSTKSSDEEVRSMVSVERMVKAGMTVQEIQRYYPECSPPTK